MNKRLRTGLVLFGLFFNTGMTILLYTTFLTAYINGGNVLVQINEYNEATIEFIFIPVFVIIGLLSTIYIIRRNTCRDTK